MTDRSGLLVEHVGKPLTVILDNASVHTARALQPYLRLLHAKGLTLYFLPPYSPELNRIEKLLAQDEIRVAGLQGPRHPNP